MILLIMSDLCNAPKSRNEQAEKVSLWSFVQQMDICTMACLSVGRTFISFLIEVSGNVLTNIVNMIELQFSQLMTNILKQLSERIFVKVPSIQTKFAETWKLLQGSDLAQKLTVIGESHLE